MVEYLSSGLSDHSPLVIRGDIQIRQGGRPFKFFNYMAEHQDFGQVVREGWNTTVKEHAMFELWENLKYVKIGLKKLQSREFAKLERKELIISEVS